MPAIAEIGARFPHDRLPPQGSQRRVDIRFHAKRRAAPCRLTKEGYPDRRPYRNALKVGTVGEEVSRGRLQQRRDGSRCDAAPHAQSDLDAQSWGANAILASVSPSRDSEGRMPITQAADGAAPSAAGDVAAALFGAAFF